MIPRQPGELEPAVFSGALRAILRVLLVALPVFLLATIVEPAYTARWLAVVGATYGVCLGSWVLDRFGRTRAAGVAAILGLWFVITACTVTAGGLGALAPWFYVIPVLVTGLLFGARAGFVASLLAALTALVLAVLEIDGRFADNMIAYSPMLRWVGLAFVLSLMAGLQWFASKTIGAAMKRSEKLTESIDGIVWEADAVSFQFTFVSAQAERLLGYPCSQWMSETDFWQNHIHDDDRAEALASCLAGIAELRPQEFEYRMIAADGRHVWIRDIVAVEAESGRAKTLRGIMMDVTAGKTAEVLLRESEERYRTLAETATDAIITFDPASRILFANAAVERMFGHARQTLVGMPFTALMPESDRRAHEAAVERYLATGLPGMPWSSRELMGLHRDGHELFLEVAFSELRIGGQHLFTGIIRDVSERRRTEDALRSSERRFSIAFNANPTPSTISTLDGRFLHANEQFLRTTGYSRDEVVGRTALELGLWPNPRQRGELMRRLHADGTVRGFDAELCTKTGERRLLSLSVERIELDGQPCLLHSGQDVTERKLAENAVRASEARLRALSARLESAREEEGRRIAREIHDELGGTLTTLKWDLEGVARSLSGPVSAGEAERIRKAVPLMMDLVESTMTTVRRIASDLRPCGTGRTGRGGGHGMAGPPVRGAHGHPVHLRSGRRRAGSGSGPRHGRLPHPPGDPDQRAAPCPGLAGAGPDPPARRQLRARGARQRPRHRAGRTGGGAVARPAGDAGARPARRWRRQDSGRCGEWHQRRRHDPDARGSPRRGGRNRLIAGGSIPAARSATSG